VAHHTTPPSVRQAALGWPVQAPSVQTTQAIQTLQSMAFEVEFLPS
jgi:hypothetical protein